MSVEDPSLSARSQESWDCLEQMRVPGGVPPGQSQSNEPPGKSREERCPQPAWEREHWATTGPRPLIPGA